MEFLRAARSTLELALARYSALTVVASICITRFNFKSEVTFVVWEDAFTRFVYCGEFSFEITRLLGISVLSIYVACCNICYMIYALLLFYPVHCPLKGLLTIRNPPKNKDPLLHQKTMPNIHRDYFIFYVISPMYVHYVVTAGVVQTNK